MLVKFFSKTKVNALAKMFPKPAKLTTESNKAKNQKDKSPKNDTKKRKRGSDDTRQKKKRRVTG